MRDVSWIAARIGVSRSWILEWHRRGLLRGILLRAEPGKGRGKLLFSESEILRFLEERGIQADAAPADEQT
jgi:transposase